MWYSGLQYGTSKGKCLISNVWQSKKIKKNWTVTPNSGREEIWQPTDTGHVTQCLDFSMFSLFPSILSLATCETPRI